jgi:hypothetical protein
MNDDTAQLLVDRLSGGLPEPAVAPIPELLRDGRGARRRRRGTTVGVAVVAIAVVAAGVALVPRLGSGSPDPAPAHGMPAPPEGMRWVGYGTQVVAVPQSWSTGDARCDVPLSDTVYVGIAGEFFCDTPPELPGVSSVRIGPIENGPAFSIDSPDLDLEEQIHNSQRELPDGWVTVPWQLYGSVSNMLRQFRAAGLEAEVVREYAPESEAGREVTVPSSGSPVELGSTVRLILPAHQAMVIEQAAAGPGDVIDVHFPEHTLRGTDYVMSLRTHSGFVDAFQLGPVVSGESGAPTWRPIGDRLPVADLAIGGEGPDLLAVPESAAPGTYRVCIENMAQPLCDMVTVVE